MRINSWRLIGVVVLVCLSVVDGMAQCAMCRGSVESSIGNGRNNVGIGLNTGILYLFVVPYLTVGVVAYFWYRSSKKAKLEREMIERVRHVMKNG